MKSKRKSWNLKARLFKLFSDLLLLWRGKKIRAEVIIIRGKISFYYTPSIQALSQKIFRRQDRSGGISEIHFAVLSRKKKH